jgi:protoporphyrinogen oxidase
MGHSMAKVERILIVGGGIAGLTATIALRQRDLAPSS